MALTYTNKEWKRIARAEIRYGKALIKLGEARLSNKSDRVVDRLEERAGEGHEEMNKALNKMEDED